MYERCFIKTQLEEVLELVTRAKCYVEDYFSVAERKKDERFSELLRILYEALRTTPRYDLAGLVIEFDPETGKPRVNDELAQRFIQNAVSKAMADADPSKELDFIEAQTAWEDTLIDRVMGHAKGPCSECNHPQLSQVKEARFMLENRLQTYRHAIIKIEAALK